MVAFIASPPDDATPIAPTEAALVRAVDHVPGRLMIDPPADERLLFPAPLLRLAGCWNRTVTEIEDGRVLSRPSAREALDRDSGTISAWLRDLSAIDRAALVSGNRTLPHKVAPGARQGEAQPDVQPLRCGIA